MPPLTSWITRNNTRIREFSISTILAKQIAQKRRGPADRTKKRKLFMG